MSIRRCATLTALLLALALLGAAPAFAATHIWTGPANGQWSNAANWSGGVPTSGEPGGTIVQFGANTTSSMNVASLVVDEIHFTGANNTISGDGTTALGINGTTLVQNIVSDAGGNTLAATLPLALTGASTEAASGAGTLTIAGNTSGSSGLIFVTTGGASALTGNNSYAGPTTISSGTLHVNSAAGVAISGSSLTIGTVQGASAQLLDNVQSSDISPNTDVTVNSDGVFNFQSEIETAKSLTVAGGSVLGGTLTMSGGLTMTDGTVAIGTSGTLSAASLSMTGGAISGAGTLALSGNISATSSNSGPATVSSSVRLTASPTVTVTAGTAPEFQITGVISETGGSRSITKAGSGTLLTSAANTYSGTTTVSAGTLVANGTQSGPFSVGQNGTLSGAGTYGATTVAGVLTPVGPGMNTGTLSFGPTGRLDMTITSVAPAALPSVFVAGTVSIDPNAALNLVVTPGIAVPHGSKLVLIGNDASDPISGQFTGVPNGSVLTTPDGVPLVVNYADGDGSDLELTASNVPPQAGSVTVTPNPVVAGQPVALTVTASDANQDPLTTTWSFGDGSTGTGAATSHTYATPGMYTAVATVSDGVAQVQSTIVINVSAPTTGGGTGAHPGGGTTAPATTSTVKSSAYGADFRLTVPRACVRKGKAFHVTLSVKRQVKAKGNVLAGVTKVVFTIGLRAKTDRFAPFGAELTIARGATGRRIKLGAKAYLRLHNRSRRTKSLVAVMKVC